MASIASRTSIVAGMSLEAGCHLPLSFQQAIQIMGCELMKQNSDLQLCFPRGSAGETFLLLHDLPWWSSLLHLSRSSWLQNCLNRRRQESGCCLSHSKNYSLKCTDKHIVYNLSRDVFFCVYKISINFYKGLYQCIPFFLANHMVIPYIDPSEMVDTEGLI